MLTSREYFWRLRNGHWVAYGGLIAAISVLLPVGILLARFVLDVPEEVEDGLNSALVPAITIALSIVCFILAHFAKGRGQIDPSKARAAVEAFREALKDKPALAEILETIEVYNVGDRTPKTRGLTDTKGVDTQFLQDRSGIDLKPHMPRATLEDGRVNTPHAFVLDEHLRSGYQTSVDEICYFNGSYNLLTAIAEAAATHNVEVPRVLGAGALVVCPQSDEILLLNKALPSQTPVYHVFGGNFEPRLRLPGASYDLDLEVNAQREVIEESGLAVSVHGCAYVMHLETANRKLAGWEARQRFLPLHFLGALIDQDQLKELRGSEEGSVKTIRFEVLAEELSRIEQWIPAAWTTVMLWLKLGAPCQDGRPVMARKAALQTYKSVMKRLSE